MNRTVRLLRYPYAIPSRPLPSTLPTNLRFPQPWSATLHTLTSKPSAHAANGNNVLLARQVLIRGLATTSDKDKKQETAPTKPHREENQNHTTGAREELKGMSRDFASLISGSSPQEAALGAREISSHSHKGSITEDFTSVTTSFITAVPKPILYTGLAGTLPYLGTSVATIVLAREASLASNGASPAGLDLPTILSYLHHVEHIQITYGAILLSFLGALHWGMEFAKLGGAQGYPRLMLGIVPVLFAWPTTFLTHGVALAVQWMGFTGMWFVDQRASNAGWTTAWYSTYRFYLSIIVGFSIIATLAGTGYYGAGAGAITDPNTQRFQHTTERQSAMKRLDRVKEKNFPPNAKDKTGKIVGTTKGDIEVEEEGSGEAYQRFTNVEKKKQEEEEKKEKEKQEAEEQKKKEKEQKEKDKGQKEKSPDGMKEDSKADNGGEKKAEEKKPKDDKPKEEKPKEEKKGDDKKSNDDKPKEEGKGQNDQQKQAQEEKGAAGDKNTGMR